jgi:hypothetical protein
MRFSEFHAIYEAPLEDLRCPFHRVLLPGDFRCSHARAVTRRDGPDVACDAPGTRQCCAEVLAHLKAVGLPALAHADDLTELPHGVAMKVQMGGLIGLQKLAGVTAASGSPVVDDVGAVVAAAAALHGGTAGIPYAELVADMSSFQLKRRRGRQDRAGSGAGNAVPVPGQRIT